jgi:hypothetical protein
MQGESDIVWTKNGQFASPSMKRDNKVYIRSDERNRKTVEEFLSDKDVAEKKKKKKFSVLKIT